MIKEKIFVKVLFGILKISVINVAGSKGHCSRVYRTLEHLCKLYKASLKGKEKEVNFTEHDDLMDDSTHLDALDFTDGFTDHSTYHNSMDTGDN